MARTLVSGCSPLQCILPLILTTVATDRHMLGVGRRRTSHLPRHVDSVVEMVQNCALTAALIVPAQAGVRNDTLVFLTGDNGPPEDQCDWGGSKGPFLGQWQKTAAAGAYGVPPGQRGGSAGKMTSWEAGHREVGVVSWPGRVPGGTVSHVLASAMDIVPTVLSLAGVPLPADRAFDGLDLAPVIFAADPAGVPASGHHRELYFSVGGEAYPQSLGRWGSQHPGNNVNPTGLFEKIRLSDPVLGQISAMYKVLPPSVRPGKSSPSPSDVLDA